MERNVKRITFKRSTTVEIPSRTVIIGAFKKVAKTIIYFFQMSLKKFCLSFSLLSQTFKKIKIFVRTLDETLKLIFSDVLITDPLENIFMILISLIKWNFWFLMRKSRFYIFFIYEQQILNLDFLLKTRSFTWFDYQHPVKNLQLISYPKYHRFFKVFTSIKNSNFFKSPKILFSCFVFQKMFLLNLRLNFWFLTFVSEFR